jgi:hypothetical protein
MGLACGTRALWGRMDILELMQVFTPVWTSCVAFIAPEKQSREILRRIYDILYSVVLLCDAARPRSSSHNIMSWHTKYQVISSTIYKSRVDKIIIFI